MHHLLNVTLLVILGLIFNELGRNGAAGPSLKLGNDPQKGVS